jgi:hypothetical protein
LYLLINIDRKCPERYRIAHLEVPRLLLRADNLTEKTVVFLCHRISVLVVGLLAWNSFESQAPSTKVFVKSSRSD